MAEFLAIKNWAQYQPKDTKSLPWIRDYKDRDWDKEYGALTCMQRYMLDACCRLRGKHGRNLPNDPLWIVRATAVLPRERHNATSAIRQLIDSGWLVLTGQQNEPLGEVRKGKERVVEERKEEPISVAASAPPEPVKAVILLPLNAGEFPVSEEDFRLWQGLYPAVDVMQELRAMAGWCHANVKKRKTKDGVKRFINSWLAKAQNNPKAAQGFREGANGQPKSEQRERRNDEKYARIEQRIAGVPEGIGTALPSGTSGSGNRDVDSRPKLLSLGRGAGSG